MLFLLFGCDSPAPAALPDWLDLGDARACDAGATPAWTDVAQAWGLGGLHDPETEHSSSAGVAYGDLDGDGDDDMALAYSGAPVTLFWRDGDSFTAGQTLPVGASKPRAVGVMDPDGDADWDLFVASQDPHFGFFRNDGGSFTDDSASWSIPEETAYNLPAEADWDGDGDLDAYVPATHPQDTVRVDVLLRNNDGRLEVEDILPDTEGSTTLQAFWLDADGDGDPDLHAVNDFGPTMGGNVMLRNDGGAFSDMSAACQCTTATGGMSGELADINRDGLPDFYLANADGNNLFVNLGDGTFVDTAASVGASERDPTGGGTMVWSAVSGDFGNDGRLDLYNAHGDFFSDLEPSDPVDAPSTLLEQGADGSFVDVAPTYGLDTVSSDRSIIADDMNGDGVLDLLVTVVDDWPHLWMSDGCTSPGWLDVELRQDGPNPWGTGTRVEIEAGGVTQTAWLWPHSGLNATKAPRVHFGLGEAQVVDRMALTLPNGEVRTVDTAFDARRRVVVDLRGE